MCGMKHKDVNWQAVFFDFDGVVADSVQVKAEAFSIMFKQYGKEIESAVVRHHLSNGGIPRKQKIDFYYREYLNRELEPSTLERLADEFSNMVVDQVVAAPLIRGVLEALETLRECGVPAYVISGTPHDEMNRIVERKKLRGFFREVHGSPLSKSDIAFDILQHNSLEPGHCLFIGDAMVDYRTAMDTGMHFLGIVSPTSPVTFPMGTPVSSFVRLTL